MINKLKLLRNIGVFDSVDTGGAIPLARLTLVYAENGRGKTTLVAVLRSLATGDPIPIAERHRLAAQCLPHAVIDCNGGPPPAVFQNGAWNRTLPKMVVFDDQFVDQNVYSGLAVEPEHRQNLHELILGAQGVTLNRRLQELVTKIEAHNTELRTKEAAIPVAERGALSVDEFCELPPHADIDHAIQAAERDLAAAREQDGIREAPLFDSISLPAFDVAAIDEVLQRDLPSLEAAAIGRVQTHLKALGPGGEAWVADGMTRVPRVPAGAAPGPCPFCAQDLAGSPIIEHYRAYFSSEYADLKLKVTETLAAVNRAHDGEVPTAFERAIRVTGERRQFWSRFCDVPDMTLDTAAIARDWRTTHAAVTTLLIAKQAAPLERMTLAKEALAAVAAYESRRQTVALLNQQLQKANAVILVVKKQAAIGNLTALDADFARLKAVKSRYTQTTADLCDDYLTEKAAKAQTEQLREQVKTDLVDHRTRTFRESQRAINLYLSRFNVGFRLDSVTHADTRYGPTCNYDLIINNTQVAVAGGTPTPGTPAFRNTLSSGDRNALALAFFFASLDQDTALASKVVVIDDPASSLDEHRSLTTVQEIRQLAGRAAQVILLSHNKRLLCGIWERTPQNTRAALQVARGGTGSTLRIWDVNEDYITEHDRRHAILREYLASTSASRNKWEAAESIRHVLEGFLRVAFPKDFPAGTGIGPFRDVCEQRAGTHKEILNADLTLELSNLLEYANRFHHDTNPAWETEVINDGELQGYAQRALDFARR